MRQLQVKAKGRRREKEVELVKDHSSRNKFCSFLMLFNSLFNMPQQRQLLPSVTKDDIADVLLNAKNIQLKQKIDATVIDIRESLNSFVPLMFNVKT